MLQAKSVSDERSASSSQRWKIIEEKQLEKEREKKK
mgnify:CR=1 FL=1